MAQADPSSTVAWRVGWWLGEVPSQQLVVTVHVVMMRAHNPVLPVLAVTWSGRVARQAVASLLAVAAGVTAAA